MKVIKTVAEIKNYCREIDSTLGLVPTMGYLHEGHLNLVKASRKICKATIVSVFVNKTQFNESVDFDQYPRDLGRDLELLKKEGVDVVFAPEFEEIYPRGYRYKIQETLGFSEMFCGQDRPGHFEGVLTIIMKLIGMVSPSHLLMGEKDFQQYKLVKEMVEDFFLDTKVEMVATTREVSGLAMSSRNERLSNESRLKASQFSHGLASRLTDSQLREELASRGFIVDYVESFEGRRFGAIRIDDVRLIDNVKI